MQTTALDQSQQTKHDQKEIPSVENFFRRIGIRSDEESLGDQAPRDKRNQLMNLGLMKLIVLLAHTHSLRRMFQANKENNRLKFNLTEQQFSCAREGRGNAAISRTGVYAPNSGLSMQGVCVQLLSATQINALEPHLSSIEEFAEDLYKSKCSPENKQRGKRPLR